MRLPLYMDFCKPSKSLNSAPLSTVILLNTLRNRLPYRRSNLFMHPTTVAVCLFGIKNIISLRVNRSVSTSKTFFVRCLPTTQSISQCPNVLRSSIVFGRCSMLVPLGGRLATALRYRFLRRNIGKSAIEIWGKIPMSIYS